MIHLRPASVAVAGLAVAGLVAGCSNEAAPTVPAAAAASASASAATVTTPASESYAPRPEATPTPSATAISPPPEQDELSKVFDETGASVFAAYFVQVLNHARTTGDPTLLRSISDPSCVGCEFHADVVDEYRVKGYVSRGFVIQFTGTRVDSWDPEVGEIGLTVSISRPRFNTVDREGQVIGTAEAEPEGEFWIDLNWVDDHWIVREVQ